MSPQNVQHDSSRKESPVFSVALLTSLIMVTLVFTATDDIGHIIFAIIFYSLCLALLIFIVLRLCLCYGFVLSSLVSFILLMIVGFPITIPWFISYCILQCPSGVHMRSGGYGGYYAKRNLSISEAFEFKSQETVRLTVLFALPEITLLGFIGTVFIYYEYMNPWITLGALNIAVYLVGSAYIAYHEHNLFWWIIGGILCVIPFVLFVICMNIVVFLWYILLFMKILDMLMSWIVNLRQIKQTYQEWKYWKTKKHLYDEFRRYDEYLKVFQKTKRKILMKYAQNNKDIVNVIIRYLNGMEVRSHKHFALFTNENGEYLNDCGVVAKYYKIKLDLVREYMGNRKLTDYTLFA